MQDVIAQWADVDEAYEIALAQIDWARAQLGALRTNPDVDPLDIASAQADITLRAMLVPDTSPAKWFLPALTEALATRAQAADGPDRLVTADNVEAVRARAAQDDHTHLLAFRHHCDPTRSITLDTVVASRSYPSVLSPFCPLLCHAL